MVAWRGVARLWLWLCLCPLVVAAKDCARIYQQKNGACGAPSVEGASVGRRGKGEGGLPTCVAGRFNSRSPFVLTQAHVHAAQLTEQLAPREAAKLSAHDFVDASSLIPSCALVGSSSEQALRGLNMGQAIDNHDLVLRLGRHLTFEQEADLGARTNVRFTDHNHMRLREDINETVVAVWCETPIKGKCSKPELMQVARTGALPLNPSFLHYATSAAFESKAPSHELIAALMLLHVCKRVDAYGLREQLHVSLDPSKRCLSELVDKRFLEDQLNARALSAHAATHKDAIAAAAAARVHTNSVDNPVARRNAALLAAREHDAQAAKEAAAASPAAAAALKRPRNLNGKGAAAARARAIYRDQLLSKLGLSQAMAEHEAAHKHIRGYLKKNPTAHPVLSQYYQGRSGSVDEEDYTGEA